MKTGPFAQEETNRMELVTGMVVGDVLMAQGAELLEEHILDFLKQTGCEAVTLEYVPGDDLIRLTQAKPTAWYRMEKHIQEQFGTEFEDRDHSADWPDWSAKWQSWVTEWLEEDRQNLLDILATIPSDWECVADSPTPLLMAQIWIYEQYGYLEEAEQPEEHSFRQTGLL